MCCNLLLNGGSRSVCIAHAENMIVGHWEVICAYKWDYLDLPRLVLVSLAVVQSILNSATRSWARARAFPQRVCFTYTYNGVGKHVFSKLWRRSKFSRVICSLDACEEQIQTLSPKGSSVWWRQKRACSASWTSLKFLILLTVFGFHGNKAHHQILPDI